MTAADILSLVDQYGQAMGRNDACCAKELQAQIDAAVTALANQRDALTEQLDSIEAAGIEAAERAEW